MHEEKPMFIDHLDVIYVLLIIFSIGHFTKTIIGQKEQYPKMRSVMALEKRTLISEEAITNP